MQAIGFQVYIRHQAEDTGDAGSELQKVIDYKTPENIDLVQIAG